MWEDVQKTDATPWFLRVCTDELHIGYLSTLLPVVQHDLKSYFMDGAVVSYPAHHRGIYWISDIQCDYLHCNPVELEGESASLPPVKPETVLFRSNPVVFTLISLLPDSYWLIFTSLQYENFQRYVITHIFFPNGISYCVVELKALSKPSLLTLLRILGRFWFDRRLILPWQALVF